MLNKKNVPKVSVIVTVLSEAQTIIPLLNSLVAQTLSADEVIIADGGSEDGTVQVIEKFAKEHSSLNLYLLQKKGNRSVGRNAAIARAQNDWIAITDAAAIASRNCVWLRRNASIDASRYCGTSACIESP